MRRVHVMVLRPCTPTVRRGLGCVPGVLHHVARLVHHLVAVRAALWVKGRQVCQSG